MNKVKVSNMISLNGYSVPNQFIIETEDGDFFQSYKTIIAFKRNDGTIALDKNSWDYSKTTLKYLKDFLGVNSSKKEMEKSIENGIYQLEDLN